MQGHTGGHVERFSTQINENKNKLAKRSILRVRLRRGANGNIDELAVFRYGSKYITLTNIMT